MPLVDFLGRQSIRLIDEFIKILSRQLDFEPEVFKGFVHQLKDRSLACAVRTTDVDYDLVHFA